MNNKEKCNELKNTIRILYSKEGRSISYISRLLEVDRKVLTICIRDWELSEPAPQRHANPSTQKFINANKQKILSMMMADSSPSEIIAATNCTRSLFKTIISVDDDLKKEHTLYWERRNSRREEKALFEQRRHEIENLPNEEWKPILGYEEYMVSNLGRVRNRFKLLSPCPNSKTGRLYISLYNKNGQVKNLLLARVVAATFCEGKTDERNTVNHIDGDYANNRASNLEWVSQSDNNKHAYSALNRKRNRINHINYTILYKDKYEFKTVAAFARFIGMSETQTRRYLESPADHYIKIIPT